MQKEIIFITIAVLGLIASYYLLIHDIRIEHGVRGDSICNINQTLDCDAVSLSKYSKVFGVPVASLGAGFYLVLLLITIIKIATNDSIGLFVLTFRLFLTSFSVFVSILLGYISIFHISAICIFCFFTYICNIFLLIISLLSIKGINIRTIFFNGLIIMDKSIELRKRLFLIFILFNALLIMLVNIFLSDFIRSASASGLKQKPNSPNVSVYKKINDIFIITAEEAYKDFYGKEDVVFVDNRPGYKFKKGHIKKAVNLTYENPESTNNVMTKSKLLEISKGKRIVFYCTGLNRAYYASKIAIEKWGFDKNRVFWFKDGFYEWSQKSHPIE